MLNIWARFIYGPLLDDRVRTIADGVKPAEYGRREAFRVHQALKQQGAGDRAARIRVHGPRRDRARRVFLHLRAELNFHRLFNAAIEDFSIDARRRRRQNAALAGRRARQPLRCGCRRRYEPRVAASEPSPQRRCSHALRIRR